MDAEEDMLVLSQACQGKYQYASHGELKEDIIDYCFKNRL